MISIGSLKSLSNHGICSTDIQFSSDPMVLCLESYSGKTDGEVGVKLEEMVLVNEAGGERLSHYPFEDSLLN